MRRKETIVEALDVTKDAALGMPVVTAVGNCEVYVENFKSIAEYDCNTVKLLTKKDFYPLKGNGWKFFIMMKKKSPSGAGLSALKYKRGVCR